MNNADFFIDGKRFSFSIEGTPEFKSGKNEVLSQYETDITYQQPWYKNGYSEEDFLNEDEFISLKRGLSTCIKKIIEQELLINTDGFILENYHQFIKSDADHLKVVSKTRDLFPEDFNFSIIEIIHRLGKILKHELTDIIPITNQKLHIIVRINRPASKDYNPPHKDNYEAVDNYSYIAPFVNFWIPVAGVTKYSSLPVAPGSHLINEDSILRTFEGGVIEGNKYRVRMVKSWNGDNNLIRSSVKYGQVLMFSPNLIHGVAVNDEPSVTRVSLEFRLFKK